jgi:hypothetical protein
MPAMSVVITPEQVEAMMLVICAATAAVVVLGVLSIAAVIVRLWQMRGR